MPAQPNHSQAIVAAAAGGVGGGWLFAISSLG